MYLYARWIWIQFPWLSLQHASTSHLDRDTSASLSLSSQRSRDPRDRDQRDRDPREGTFDGTDRGSSRLACTARSRMLSQTGTTCWSILEFVDYNLTVFAYPK